MSGVQAVPQKFEFVYVEVRASLKVQGSDPDDGGYERNVQLMAEAEEEALSLAKKINSELKHFIKKHKHLKLIPVDKEYEFFEKEMTGFAKFPTLISDSDAEAEKGKPFYFQLNRYPRVIVRFNALPEVKHLAELKALVLAILSPVDLKK